METKKIAIGCFIGGATGVVVALICVPMFWWLGMLAGFGAGYLCCDLKEVREMVPVAWQTARKGSRYSLNWLKKPHPFLVLYLITTLIITCLFIKYLTFAKDISPVAISLFFGAPLGFVGFIAELKLSKTGVERKKCFWKNCEFYLDETYEEMLKKGYKVVPLTYRSVYGLTLTGLGYLSLTAFLGTPKVLKVIGKFIFYRMWIVIAKFLWILFKLIHSQKRVLCGFDSAIGVALTYILLGSKAVTPGQQVMVVICGGIIGAVVGVLNFEIISKRLLHLVPATSSA